MLCIFQEQANAKLKQVRLYSKALNEEKIRATIPPREEARERETEKETESVKKRHDKYEYLFEYCGRLMSVSCESEFCVHRQ